MGLIKKSDWLRPRNALQRQYEGTVVQVNDPRMLGRIKVSIDGLMDTHFVSTEHLPWCYPQLPAHLGDAASGTNMVVPELNSTVLIEFPDRHIYHPVYRWRVSSRQTRPTDFQSEYPYRYGHSDRAGNKSITSTAPNKAFQETRSQDGLQKIHDLENSVTLFSDQYGTIFELDRKNQKLFASFAGIELTVTQAGITLNAPSLSINCEDAISLLASKGVDTSVSKEGTNIDSYLTNIANTMQQSASEEDS
ncbi:hypothetical protein CWB96_00370 [Pseudoalteromonas citrea]|uniref:Gp5/Type VI secretion system Vgr protein OB-fold domain-containing protein n=1 Tax=Pseudoalteromonas citrea TaxID=43655 RepID=A0A5S3XVH5_9GAMM|nr:phage baseplate assembly protein V [Pseudoalteromonas citrea]TMP46321.1 hypothetical protein CWB97_02365 [Pseudoalteromonas citrea]TMP63097.1 hypothetical protein CWB96_00370 [Pseudoalteromonas citrea]